MTIPAIYWAKNVARVPHLRPTRSRLGKELSNTAQWHTANDTILSTGHNNADFTADFT